MHKAREICGVESWESMARMGSLRNYAGISLAFLADTKALPLKMHVTKSGKGSKHYWMQPALPFVAASPVVLPKPVILSGKTSK